MGRMRGLKRFCEVLGGEKTKMMGDGKDLRLIDPVGARIAVSGVLFPDFLSSGSFFSVLFSCINTGVKILLVSA